MGDKPSVKDALREATLRRALARKRRKCRTHPRTTTTLCPRCVRTYCLLCAEVCPWCKKDGYYDLPPKLLPTVMYQRPPRKNAGPYQPPIFLMPVWNRLATMGVERILPHPDSGGFQAEFPFDLPAVYTTADLLEQVFDLIGDLADRTPFGGGRTVAPAKGWYVTLKLK